MKQSVPPEARTRGGYLKYLDKLKYLSQKNRKSPTQSEKKFWTTVLSQDKTGYRFLRQKPIGQLIVDFYCPVLAVVIEIDGSSHNTRQNYDFARNKYLEDRGIITIRYSNDLVDNNIDSIVTDLKRQIKKRILELDLDNAPPLSKRGLGGDLKSEVG